MNQSAGIIYPPSVGVTVTPCDGYRIVDLTLRGVTLKLVVLDAELAKITASGQGAASLMITETLTTIPV